jgi:hypothetical protein
MAELLSCVHMPACVRVRPAGARVSVPAPLVSVGPVGPDAGTADRARIPLAAF